MVLFAQDYPNKKHIFEQIRLQVKPHPNKNTHLQEEESVATPKFVSQPKVSYAAKVTILFYLNCYTAITV